MKKLLILIFILQLCSSYATRGPQNKESNLLPVVAPRELTYDKHSDLEGISCTKRLHSSLNEIVSIGEKMLLEQHISNPNAKITRELLSACLGIDESSKNLVSIFAKEEIGSELKDLNAQLRIFFQLKISELSNEFVKNQCKLKMSTTKLKKVINELNLLKVTLDDAINFFKSRDDDNSFQIMELVDTVDLLTDKQLSEEITGRLLAEIICSRVKVTVEDGNIDQAMNEISAIFGDLGILLTAYATGLTLCSLSLGTATCGVSVVISSAGTIVFISRLRHHLDELQKVVQE